MALANVLACFVGWRSGGVVAVWWVQISRGSGECGVGVGYTNVIVVSGVSS